MPVKKLTDRRVGGFVSGGKSGRRSMLPLFGADVNLAQDSLPDFLKLSQLFKQDVTISIAHGEGC
jgi:hypothetical protein